MSRRYVSWQDWCLLVVLEYLLVHQAVARQPMTMTLMADLKLTGLGLKWCRIAQDRLARRQL